MDMMDCIKNMLKEFLVKFQEPFGNTAPAGMDVFGADNSKKSKKMKTVFLQTTVQWHLALYRQRSAHPDYRQKPAD